LGVRLTVTTATGSGQIRVRRKEAWAELIFLSSATSIKISAEIMVFRIKEGFLLDGGMSLRGTVIID